MRNHNMKKLLSLLLVLALVFTSSMYSFADVNLLTNNSPSTEDLFLDELNNEIQDGQEEPGEPDEEEEPEEPAEEAITPAAALVPGIRIKHVQVVDGGAVQAGYRYAYKNGYDIAVQIDGDGQHDITQIEKILHPIKTGVADMVIGSRFIDKQGFQSSLMRRFGIKIISIVIRLCCGAKITDATSGFRAVGSGLIKQFANEYAHDYPEPEAIVAAVLNGFRVYEVPVEMNERTSGESSINKLRAVYYMLKVPLALLVYRLGVKNIKHKKLC